MDDEARRRKRFQKRFFQPRPFLMYWHQKINAQQFATPDCVFDLRCASECSRGDDHRTIHLPFGSRGDAGEVVLKSAAEGNDIDAAEEWLEEWINALKVVITKYKRREAADDAGAGAGGDASGGAADDSHAAPPLPSPPSAEQQQQEDARAAQRGEMQRLHRENERLKQEAAASAHDVQTRVAEVQHAMQQAIDKQAADHSQELEQALFRVRREYSDAGIEQKATRITNGSTLSSCKRNSTAKLLRS